MGRRAGKDFASSLYKWKCLGYSPFTNVSRSSKYGAVAERAPVETTPPWGLLQNIALPTFHHITHLTHLLQTTETAVCAAASPLSVVSRCDRAWCKPCPRLESKYLTASKAGWIRGWLLAGVF